MKSFETIADTEQRLLESLPGAARNFRDSSSMSSLPQLAFQSKVHAVYFLEKGLVFSLL